MQIQPNPDIKIRLLRSDLSIRQRNSGRTRIANNYKLPIDASSFLDSETIAPLDCLMMNHFMTALPATMTTTLSR